MFCCRSESFIDIGRKLDILGVYVNMCCILPGNFARSAIH